MSVVSVKYSEDKPTCVETLTTTGIDKTIVVCYCVEWDDVCDGPQQIKLEASVFNNPLDPNSTFLPLLGTLYEYKNEFDPSIFVTKLGDIKYNKDNCLKGTICVTYGTLTGGNGNPTEDPTSIPKQVDIEFVEESRPGTSFEYQGTCDGEGNEVTGLNQLVLSPGQIGPIRNSAGCPIRRNCLEYRHILRVRTYVQSWDCSWGDVNGPLGKWNDSPITIIEEDDFSILFNCEYPECSLQLLNIDKTNVVYQGRTYLCLDWVLSYDPDGYQIKQLDAGTQALFIPGAQDPSLLDSGGLPCAPIPASDGRLERNKTGKRDLGVSEPILLNGQGVEWCCDNSSSPANTPPFYLLYTKVDSKYEFNNLPICP